MLNISRKIRHIEKLGRKLYNFTSSIICDNRKNIFPFPSKYLRIYHFRFMHDRSLVSFLNGFADTSVPLPRGWEQKTDQFGQVQYNLSTSLKYHKSSTRTESPVRDLPN